MGWDRGADLLSGLIPQIYFDYLRGGPPERLVPVLNHNQMDLRGLAALSSRILSLLSDAETLGQDGLELFGVSRICEKRGEHTRARKLYEKSIASVLPTETDRAARRSLARLAKREGDFDLACELWKDASEIHGMAMRPMSNSRFTTNTRPVIQSKLDRLSLKHSMNFAVQFRWATSRRAPIANSRRDSIAEWSGWNERVEGRYWIAWPSKLRPKGE